MDSLLKIGLNYQSLTQITIPLIGLVLFTTVLLAFFIITIYHAKKYNKQSSYQAENPQDPSQNSISSNFFPTNLKSFLLMLLLISIFIECEIQSFPEKRTTTEGIKLSLLHLSFSHHLQSPSLKLFLGFIMVIYANFRLTPIDAWLQNICFLIGSIVLGLCFSIPYKKVHNPDKLSTKSHAKTILFQSQKSLRQFEFPSVPSFIVNKLWKKSTVSLVLLDAHLKTVYKTPVFDKLFKNRPLLEIKLKSLKFKLLDQSPTTPKFSNHIQSQPSTLRDFLLKLISNSAEENHHRNLSAKLEECPPAISTYVYVYRYYDKKSMFFAIILESSRDELSQLVQNQSKILSFVSHEFRTPLNCVTGMLQCMEDNVPQNVYEQYIQPALSSSKYLMNMLQDILDMTQIKAGKFRLNNLEFDLTLFLRDIFTLFQVQSKTKKIQLSFQIDPSVPKLISTDPNRLKQVVINLVSNAFKYTQKEGSITLYGELVDNNPRILRISVEDTGLGIKECDKPRLLKAFGKIEDEKNHEMNPQGVGLGLIISQDISKLLAEGLTDIPESEKGLKFESQYEKGSVFSFIFDNLKALQPHDLDTAEIRFDSIAEDGPEWNVEVLKSNDQSCRFFHRSGSGSRRPGYQIVFNKQLTRKGGLTKKMTQIVCQMSFADVDSTYHKNQITKSFPNSDNNIMFKSNVMDGLKSLGDNKPVHISEKSSLLHELSISFSSNSNKTPSDISKLQEIVSKVENFHKKCLCPDVLVVDDDSYNILALQFLLESLNISFETASSGIEAVDRVVSMETESTCCKQYRLILLDIEMPGKNGLETCREIRKYFHDSGLNDDTHIVACSGYNDKEMDEKIKEAGFNYKLVKPIMKGTLIGVLAEVMSQLNFDSPMLK